MKINTMLHRTSKINEKNLHEIANKISEDSLDNFYESNEKVKQIIILNIDDKPFNNVSNRINDIVTVISSKFMNIMIEDIFSSIIFCTVFDNDNKSQADAIDERHSLVKYLINNHGNYLKILHGQLITYEGQFGGHYYIQRCVVIEGGLDILQEFKILKFGEAKEI
jgi:hypothetical protein